jgi:hypothetical protein
MSKLLPVIVIVILLLNACTNEPKSFWDSPNAFLGQIPPNDTPKPFAPGLLADTGGIALDRVAFSPDGREFYYCHNTSWFSSTNLKIKAFKFTGDRWQWPVLINETFNSPTFSMDGNTLYFPGGDSTGAVVWQSNRSDSGWTKPSAYLRASYSLYDFMPTKSGNMYIGTNGRWGNAKDYSCFDIARLNVNGKDTVLQNLGTPLNTTGAFDGDFFVAPDESYIIISTKETKDFECELYISFRTADGKWNTPKSLGPLINNGLAHRWGQYVTPDKKYLFYTQATSEKDCKIYWVRFDKLLEKLKAQN